MRILLSGAIFFLAFGELFPIYSQDGSHLKSVKLEIYFNRGFSTIDTSYNGNAQHISEFIDSLKLIQRDSSFVISSISIYTSASPDGSLTANELLSKKRGENIKKALIPFLDIPESSYNLISKGIDWERLAQLVESSDLPDKAEIVDIIRNTPIYIFSDNILVSGRKKLLMDYKGGRLYMYLYDNYFPLLRDGIADVICTFVKKEIEPNEKPQYELQEMAQDNLQEEPQETSVDTVQRDYPQDSISYTQIVEEEIVVDKKVPAKIAFKTNALYDIALIPNIGVEFFSPNENFSFGANWAYAWWSIDRLHNYWRVYGGDVYMRTWFGRRRHHAGIYAQMLTYDFELGGPGRLSDTWTYGAGVEYGFNIPLSSRLSLDFTIGAGVANGEYKVYHPEQMLYSEKVHYVWDRTEQLLWFGPTKAEIALVWYLWGKNKKEKISR